MLNEAKDVQLEKLRVKQEDPMMSNEYDHEVNHQMCLADVDKEIDEQSPKDLVAPLHRHQHHHANLVRIITISEDVNSRIRSNIILEYIEHIRPMSSQTCEITSTLQDIIKNSNTMRRQ
jgi:hypothetical protein